MHKALVLSPGTEGNGKVGDTFILSSETMDDSRGGGIFIPGNFI